MRALYSILLVLARPLVRLRLMWRARKAPGYGERIAERYGWPRSFDGWSHTSRHRT